MKTKLLLFLSLLLVAATGAMAQNGWDTFYTQTQTTSPEWESITSSSTAGKVLGVEGTTKYYCIRNNNLSFTNSNAGESGLTIKGTVYLFVPAGITITCNGAAASGQKGAGAGIELTAGNTLYIIGGGTVIANGGKAANGGNGGSGYDAFLISDNTILGGSGGNGGNGGGGAGAGIGTRGANGGTGGNGGLRTGDIGQETTQYGVDGDAGSAGSTAGEMGTLYVNQTFGTTVNATGGSAGTIGEGGLGGKTASQHPGSNVYMASGGGGGGAGGFGGAASNIGTGGPGGGGGGGGAAGNVAWVVYSGTANGYYYAGAKGGHGGQNSNNTYAPVGTDVWLANPKHADYQGVGLRPSASDYTDCAGWEDGNAWHDGGYSGGCGVESTDKETISGEAAKLKYKLQFKNIKADLSKDERLEYNKTTGYYEMEYSPSAGANIVLPLAEDGYQWVLLTYGRDCAPQGIPANEFATATKSYYGGNVSEAERTIVPSYVYGDLLFQEIPTRFSIINNDNNQDALEKAKQTGYPITVRLLDRTLYRDNHWNTICLPFSMTPEQISASPLRGAQIMKMDNTNTGFYPNGLELPSAHIYVDYPIVLLYFEDANPSVNGLQAGKPYLVKWAEGDDLTTDGNYVDNTSKGDSRHELDFPNVTITETVAGSWYANEITFQGTFSLSADLEAGDMTKLMLGAEDMLYHPRKTINVDACRGYFIIPEEAAASARQFVMGFDDGVITGIKTLNVKGDSQDNAPIYNLSGQRLSAPQKGVNIVNGKKILVK